MDVYDAAERYQRDNHQVIILAGKEYGSGSSRDWAAKGPWILVSLVAAFTLQTVCETVIIHSKT